MATSGIVWSYEINHESDPLVASPSFVKWRPLVLDRVRAELKRRKDIKQARVERTKTLEARSLNQRAKSYERAYLAAARRDARRQALRDYKAERARRAPLREKIGLASQGAQRELDRRVERGHARRGEESLRLLSGLDWGVGMQFENDTDGYPMSGGAGLKSTAELLNLGPDAKRSIRLKRVDELFG